MPTMEARTDLQRQTGNNIEENDVFQLESEINLTPEQTESDNLNQLEGYACLASGKRFHQKFKTEERFREKIFYSVCLFIGKLIQGWGNGIIGPSFIDIRMISGTDLDRGSWILTSRCIGFALGSLAQGVSYGRVNRKLTFCASICLYGITSVLIPWCGMLEAMIFAFIMFGFTKGFFASGISAETMRIWGKNGRLVFLESQLILAVGSTLSPLSVAPFLIEQPNDMLNTSSAVEYEIIANITDGYSEPYSSQQWESEIYIPYSLMAAISFLCALLFFILYIKYDHGQTNRLRKNVTDADSKARQIPKYLKMFVLLIIGVTLFLFQAVYEPYTGFLTTYSVQYFQWVKQDGALLTFVYFALNTTGRAVGIFVERWMNTIIYTVASCILMFLSILGMLMISLYNFDVLSWFFVSLSGLGSACVFPLLMSWVNEYITPMTGRISAFYYICIMIGGALSPILCGHVMENVGLIWFWYLLLIYSIAVLLALTIGVVTTRYIVCHFGRPSYTKTAEDNISNSRTRTI